MPTETPALTAADVFNAAMAVCGYSEKAMADELEVSPSSVNRWRTGKNMPDAGSALRLARITGLAHAGVLRAFGYDPLTFGLADMAPTGPGAPTTAFDLRLLRVGEMLEQFAREVKAMATESQPHNGSVQHASDPRTHDDYSYQTGVAFEHKRPVLTVVRSAHAHIPQPGGFANANAA